MGSIRVNKPGQRKFVPKKTSQNWVVRKVPFKRSRISNLPAYNPASTRTERKSIDLAILTAGANTFLGGGRTFQISGIPIPGTAGDQRVGRSIKMMSLHIRGRIAPSLAGVGAADQSTARIIVLYDRQTNGALPAAADVMMDSTGATGTLTGLNMNNKERFIVLRDRQISLPAIGAGGITPAAVTSESDLSTDKYRNYNEYIKLSGLEQTYIGAAANFASIAQGSLFCMLFCDAATEAWGFQVGSRLRYEDA